MFDIWFCPNYPIDAIRLSVKDRTKRKIVQAALAENIRENGLVNPIIVLNHRPKKYIDHHVMQGINRLEACKMLGWSTVPCIVTGECEFDPKKRVQWDNLPPYFPDGIVTYRGGDTTFYRPHIANVVLPETYQYPKTKGQYLHEDYKSIPV